MWSLSGEGPGGGLARTMAHFLLLRVLGFFFLRGKLHFAEKYLCGPVGGRRGVKAQKLGVGSLFCASGRVLDL
jgi:hypothetical protein